MPDTSGEPQRNKNRVANCSSISNRHSSSRVTLSGPFIFGCASRQISARFRETCFQFRVRLSRCSLCPRCYVLSRCNVIRHSARLTDPQTDSRVFARYAARAHLRANEAAFRCGLGYRPYFKPDASRASLRNRVLDATRITTGFLIAMYVST